MSIHTNDDLDYEECLADQEPSEAPDFNYHPRCLDCDYHEGYDLFVTATVDGLIHFFNNRGHRVVCDDFRKVLWTLDRDTLWWHPSDEMPDTRGEEQ